LHAFQITLLNLPRGVICSVAHFRHAVRYSQPSLWNCSLEFHLFPYLRLVWGWWCLGWTTTCFPLHTLSDGFFPQEVRILISTGVVTGFFSKLPLRCPPEAWMCNLTLPYFHRQERRMCLFFCTRKTTNSFFFHELIYSMNWLKAFSLLASNELKLAVCSFALCVLRYITAKNKENRCQNIVIVLPSGGSNRGYKRCINIVVCTSL
jgi:hypothetical protein